MKRHSRTILVLLTLVAGFAVSVFSDSAEQTSHFEDYGVSFDYPVSMKLEKQTGMVTVVSLEGTNDTSMFLMIYPAGFQTEEQLHAISLRGFRTSTSRSERSKNRREKTTARTILGADRQGTTFLDTWIDRERITEFYTFRAGNTIFSFNLQHLAANSETAEQAFAIILKTLKLKSPQQPPAR